LQRSKQPKPTIKSFHQLPAWFTPERAFSRALACLGLENGHAARDIRDLRGLIDAWREARRTVWQTTVKVLTTGVLAALLVGIAIKLRLMGGPQ